MPQDIKEIEKSCKLGIVDPAVSWSSDGKKIQNLQDADFNEPGTADISPDAKRLLSNYANEQMRHGRRDSKTGNTLFPKKAFVESPQHTKSTELEKVSSGNNGNVYAEPNVMTNIESKGLGVPDITHVPGPDSKNGQKIGTFFTNEQINDLEKKDKDVLKLYKDISEQVVSNLSKTNNNSPDNKYIEEAMNPFASNDFDSFGQRILYVDQKELGVFTDRKPLFDKNVDLPENTDNDLITVSDLFNHARELVGQNKYHFDQQKLNLTNGIVLDVSDNENAFATQSELSNLQSKGLGIPKIDHTPGSDPDNGQKIGSFFSNEQIKNFEKNESFPADIKKIAVEIDKQLNLANPYNPSFNVFNENLEAVPSKDDDKKKMLFAGQTTLGVFEDSRQPDHQQSVETLSLFATEKTKKNAYHSNETVVISEAKDKLSVSQDNAFAKSDVNITGKSEHSLNNVLETTSNGTDKIISASKEKVGSGGFADLIKSVVDNGQYVPKPGQTDNYSDTSDDKNQIIHATVEMLKKNNMFYPLKDSTFFKGGSYNEDDAISSLFTIQRELGKFNAGETATKVRTSDMAAIAMALLSKATGDTNTANLIAGGNEIAQNLANEAVAQIGTQMGFYGVPLSELSITGIVTDNKTRADIIRGATGNSDFMMKDSTELLYSRGLPPNNNGSPSFVSKAYNSVSHGQLNNYLEPFGDGLMSSVGMLTLATTSIATIIGLSLIVESISQAIVESEDISSPTSPETLAFGRHAKHNPTATIEDFMLRSLLRIPKTDYNFGRCIGGGLNIMVGFPGTFIASGDVQFGLADAIQLQNFAINLLSTPGYYANYMRQIVMSGQQIASSFQQLKNLNPVTATEQFFNSVQKLSNSKVWQFMMIAASLGDANLKSLYGSAGVAPDDVLLQLKQSDGQQLVNPNLDILKDGELDTKTYAQNAKLRSNITRWGSTSKNPLSLSTFLATSVQDPRASSLSTLRSLKVDKSKVQEIENALEAEYMPFYFHDLRTSEIISLPAFVSSFDETYTPSYNAITSYGRQDPVRLHQSTERTINLVFKMIAFSEEDFDNMYYTINKFVTMCYPQYSRGLQRNYDKNNTKYVFEQPFSQVPAASPMIRIRLGDLFKSNYSKTSLQRLFGVGSERFTIEGEKDPSQDTQEEKWKLYKNKVNEYECMPIDKKDRLLKSRINGGNSHMFILKEGFVSLATGLRSVLDVNTSTDTFYLTSNKNFLKIKESESFDINNGFVTAHFDVYDINTGKKVSNGNFLMNSTLSLKNVPLSLFTLDKKEGDTYNGSIYEEVVETFGKDKQVEQAKEKQGHEKFIDNQAQFFDSENNSIVKSFESTRGKGLAGFITSLALNYGDSVWEIKEGSRAPKYVEIAMSFAPIHDLPVGLDYDGRIRAPSHPVGSVMKNFGSVYDEQNKDDNTGYESRLNKLTAKAKRGGA